MCGRYTLHSKPGVLSKHFGTVASPEFKPRYNIAPSSLCPVVRLKNDAKEIIICHWGLIPHWAKDDAKIKPINAKAETLSDRPYFRQAYKNRRCLVPANGFYEWQGKRGSKTPFYIHPVRSEFFAFAGLWESWQGPDNTIESFTIITTSANKTMSAIHPRMPVIISSQDYDSWLEKGADGLLKPCGEDKIAAYPVSARANNPANDSAELIQMA